MGSHGRLAGVSWEQSGCVQALWQELGDECLHPHKGQPELGSSERCQPFTCRVFQRTSVALPPPKFPSG